MALIINGTSIMGAPFFCRIFSIGYSIESSI